MKQLLTILSLFIACLIGCTTTQQSVTYKTLFGLETATVGAYDAYSASVIKGAIATNDVPKVSHVFNDFQASMQVAIVAAQNNTNALAPASLVQESDAVINLITTITGAK